MSHRRKKEEKKDHDIDYQHICTVFGLVKIKADMFENMHL